MVTAIVVVVEVDVEVVDSKARVVSEPSSD
jgi:hypothetical protein